MWCCSTFCKIGLYITFFIFSLPSFAQQRCYFNTDNKEIYTKQRVNDDGEELVINLVFHLFTQQRDIHDLAKKIHEQVDILNRFFATLVPASSLYPDARPIIGHPKLRFKIAEINSNSAYHGIYFHSSSEENLANFDNITNGRRSIKHSSLGGADAIDPLRFVNVWIGSRNDGIGGDSSFPSQVGEDEDGIVLGINYVGFQSAFLPYGRGMTLVHEMGHYMGLLHPWGLNGSCESDDNISDTPLQESFYRGCPKPPQISCGSIDLIYNIMDFHDDQCLLFFTHEQAMRMRTIILSTRQQLISEPVNPESAILEEVQLVQDGNFLILANRELKPLDFSFKLVDITGKIVISQNVVMNSVKRFEVSHMRSGLYLAIFENNNSHNVRKIFLHRP